MQIHVSGVSAQVKVQFSTSNITAKKTKFKHIVASLPPEYAAEVHDLLLHPLAESLYDVLNEQLVNKRAL